MKKEIIIVEVNGEKCYSPQINGVDILNGRHIYCNAIRMENVFISIIKIQIHRLCVWSGIIFQWNN